VTGNGLDNIVYDIVLAVMREAIFLELICKRFDIFLNAALSIGKCSEVSGH
jgi:hypothetical protein